MRVWIVSWPLILVGFIIGFVLVVLLAALVLLGLVVWLAVLAIGWLVRLVRSP